MKKIEKLRLPPKERILKSAEELFTAHPISTVTLTDIAMKASTSITVLNRHFSSKEHLIEEWLKKLCADFQFITKELGNNYKDDPIAIILGFGQYITNSLSGFLRRGCPFNNTLIEIGETSSRIKDFIINHKKEQYGWILTQCLKMNNDQPIKLAREITMIIEGSLMVSLNHVFEDAGNVMNNALMRRLTRAQ